MMWEELMIVNVVIFIFVFSFGLRGWVVGWVKFLLVCLVVVLFEKLWVFVVIGCVVIVIEVLV